MRSHHDAARTLVDVAEGLQEQMDQKNSRPNVIVSKNRMQTLNEYVFLFAVNLNSIIEEYNLSKVEIRIVLKIIEYMQFGNLISISNSKLAADLKMDRSNISKVLKRLKKTELIVEDEGNLFFNPHIAAKGTLDERLPKHEYLLDYSAVVLEEYKSPATPSIATKNIRRRYKEKQTTSHQEIQDKINHFFNDEEENK